MVSNTILYISSVIVVFAILAADHHGIVNLASWGLRFPKQTVAKSFPRPSMGTIIITDAAYGDARDIAHLLADYGFHVLAGVSSESEAKSFAYDQKKGYLQLYFS